MKKLLGKLLVFSMIATMLSASAMATDDSTNYGTFTLDNSQNVFENYYYTESDGTPILVHECEDYATITLTDDAYWVSIHEYANGTTTKINSTTKSGLIDVTGNVTLTDNSSTMTIDEYHLGYFNGIIDWSSNSYINAGATFKIYAQGTYLVEVTSADSAQTTVSSMFLINDKEPNYITGTAKAATAKVIVDGELTSFEAYEINGNNYFKLRDLAQVISGTDKQFEVTWDAALYSIGLISGESYTSVGGELSTGDSLDKSYVSTTAKIYKDNLEVRFEAYEINGNNYFKLRDVCESFDVGVTWDADTYTIGVDTSIGYVAD